MIEKIIRIFFNKEEKIPIPVEETYFRFVQSKIKLKNIKQLFIISFAKSIILS